MECNKFLFVIVINTNCLLATVCDSVEKMVELYLAGKTTQARVRLQAARAKLVITARRQCIFEINISHFVINTSLSILVINNDHPGPEARCKA